MFGGVTAAKLHNWTKLQTISGHLKWGQSILCLLYSCSLNEAHSVVSPHTYLASPSLGPEVTLSGISGSFCFGVLQLKTLKIIPSVHSTELRAHTSSKAQHKECQDPWGKQNRWKSHVGVGAGRGSQALSSPGSARPIPAALPTLLAGTALPALLCTGNNRMTGTWSSTWSQPGCKAGTQHLQAAILTQRGARMIPWRHNSDCSKLPEGTSAHR